MPKLPRPQGRTYETYAKILRSVNQRPDRITAVYRRVGVDYDSMNWHTIPLIMQGLLELDEHDNTLQVTRDGQECLQAFDMIEQYLTRMYVARSGIRVTKKMWLDYL